MIDWAAVISRWQKEYGSVRLLTYPPAPEAALEQAMRQVALPDDLAALYRCSNGLTCGWFGVFPILDLTDIKHTWNSLQRANDPHKTEFLQGDEELQRRFLVFAHLDAGRCAAVDRSDGSLWYEEEEALHQTTFSLPAFIETCLREVRDL